MSILTTHCLAQELLKRDNMTLAASDGKREYVIENFNLRKNYLNHDDTNMYLQLNLREVFGNIIR